MAGNGAATIKTLAVLLGALCLAPASRAAGPADNSASRPALVRVGGTGASLGLLRLLGDAFQRTYPHMAVVVVQRLGSPGGVRAVLDGALDLGFSSRPLSPQERARGARAVVIGRTPFVVVAGAQTPVAGLTVAQLAPIFALERVRWGDGTPVRVVFRPATDSDTGILAAMSPALDAALRASLARPGIRIAATDQDAMDEVERLPGSIGTSSLVLLVCERRTARVLPLNGVMPSLAALGDGRYPWHKRIWLVTGPRVSEAAQAFIGFLRSPEAAQLMAAKGMLPEPVNDEQR